MAKLKGGTTIAGYTAIHDGNVSKKIIKLSAEDMAKVEKTGIDADGRYVTVEHRREDNTLSIKSTVSAPNALGRYTKVAVVYYDVDGAYILYSETRTITYDANGNIQRIV